MIHESMESLVNELRKQGYFRIYLSHEPWEEDEARIFAEKLNNQGFQVIVAADVRPHKDKPHNEDDLHKVSQTIDSCDVVLVYGAATSKMKGVINH